MNMKHIYDVGWVKVCIVSTLCKLFWVYISSRTKRHDQDHWSGCCPGHVCYVTPLVHLVHTCRENILCAPEHLHTQTTMNIIDNGNIFCHASDSRLTNIIC